MGSRQEYFAGRYDTEQMQLAGSEGYGRWLKEERLWEGYPPIYHDWLNRVEGTVREIGTLRFVDVGCGNGKVALPLIRTVAEHYKKVEAVLLDLQSEGLTDIQIGEGKYKANKISIVPIQANVARLPVPSNWADGIISTMALHWVNEADLKSGLEDCLRILAPGGRMLVDTCSVYNAMGIGKGDIKKLEEMQRRSANGTSVERVPIYHAGFQQMVYLFTEAAAGRLCAEAGFEVEGLEMYKNGFPNGWGDEYKEGISFIARKGK